MGPKLDCQADHYKSSAPKLTILAVWVGFLLLSLVSQLRLWVRYLGISSLKEATETDRDGYPVLFEKFEYFYGRHLCRRLKDGWCNPLRSAPAGIIDIVDRYSDDQKLTFKLRSSYTSAVNMGSYNYLGMAENSGPRLEEVCRTIQKYGASSLASRAEFGVVEPLAELEQRVADYLGVEAALVLAMGFATNSNNIPVLAGDGEGTLILSDELNHASLILGCKSSGATCVKFKHNDTRDLERRLRKALLQGQAISAQPFKPWRKAIIITEGIFSMEGTIVDLPEIIRIKKKYKAYLYLDEAHSIGALNRGVVFHYGCQPSDVDVLMGTFTKSFGAAGGYIAGTRRLINYLRLKSHATCYATTMAAPVARQVIGVINSIVGCDGDPRVGEHEGLARIKRLQSNTRYFRQRLRALGFAVIGSDDSPVVPVMIYSLASVFEIIREALSKNVALVGAGFPATALYEARIRFCLSSAHTREMLDHVIDVMDDIGTRYRVKYARPARSLPENEHR